MTDSQETRRAVPPVARRLAARVPSGDQGVAMILVLGVALALSALVAATLVLTVGGVRNARADQDWQASLPAAEAGVDHYLSRLNGDGDYWKYGDPGVSYSAGSTLTLPTGANANPAFTGWTEVPGSAGRASFRYAVNTSEFFTTGVIRLQSTGRVGNRTRTVETTIGRRNFIDYLYFTDFEVQDPALYVAGPDSYNASDAATRCSRHLYDLDASSNIRFDRVNSDIATRSSGCTNINFVGPRPGFAGDTINGPFHSNDAVYVCSNPTITAEASTSYDGSLTSSATETRHYVRNVGCGATSTPQIASSGNDFVYKAPLTLPPDNKDLSRQVNPAYTTPAAPGCLYTGPTEIVFQSGGKMQVTSPWSANGGAAFCGTGNNVPIPTRGVIWVRNVPATSDAYSRPTPVLEPGASCDGANNPLGYPQKVGSRRDRTPYSCYTGDAIVSGSMSGRLTVGAENNVVIADDLRYANSSCSASSTCTDVLGLIANNFVETMHPYGCDTSGADCANLSNKQDNLVVEAAILSVAHGFRTQNHSLGAPLGTLTVRGSIGQKFRGAVGTSGSAFTGYSKNYNYDWRLRYASPPYFLDPVKSSYGQKTWSEPPAAYAATAP